MNNMIGQLGYMKYVCLHHKYECMQFLRYVFYKASRRLVPHVHS